jgi:signal transduction histidine kinase
MASVHPGNIGFEQLGSYHQTLVEALPVGIVQICRTGKILYANQLFLKQLGLSETPAVYDEVKRILGETPEGFPGKEAKYESDFTSAKGQEHRAIIRSSGWHPKHDAAGEMAVISIGDVSEMVELQRVNRQITALNNELNEKMRLLQEAQAEIVRKGRLDQLGQLTAIVANELRNPLGAVRTSTFLLRHKIAGKDPGIEPQLDRIDNGISRCDNIITQLLDYSRSTALDAPEGDLDQWLESVVNEERDRIGDGIAINLHCGLKGAQLPFDAPRIQRAVVNLISNAAEAMLDKDGKLVATLAPRIVISTRMDLEHAILAVADNGPGISPDHLTKIREPLFTTKSFGTGLGIPAIEKIAELHGGCLDIQSELGQGATFTIRLPFQRAKV